MIFYTTYCTNFVAVENFLRAPFLHGRGLFIHSTRPRPHVADRKSVV